MMSAFSRFDIDAAAAGYAAHFRWLDDHHALASEWEVFVDAG
jgi:hypothetical protein